MSGHRPWSTLRELCVQKLKPRVNSIVLLRSEFEQPCEYFLRFRKLTQLVVRFGQSPMRVRTQGLRRYPLQRGELCSFALARGEQLVELRSFVTAAVVGPSFLYCLQ